MDENHLGLLWSERNAARECFGNANKITWSEHMRWFHEAKCQKLVAIHQGRVVGFVTILGVTIGNVIVLRAYRSMGLGKSLIEAAVNKIGGAAELEVKEDNLHAVRLYLKCGFKQIATRREMLVMRKQS